MKMSCRTKSNIYFVSGIICVALGVCFGIYVGAWLFFVKGIAQIVEAVKGDINGLDIGMGIIRVFAGGIAGVLSGAIVSLPGIYLIHKAAE